MLFGTPGGTRTPNLVVRTHLLYPIELPGHAASLKQFYHKNHRFLVRVEGVEPSSPAWKAGILAIELHSHKQIVL